MNRPARRPATYADLEAVPPHRVAEIVRGVLETHPRPPRHVTAATRLGSRLGNPFDFGEGGPGGWIFMAEPELHFGPDVVVPDLAGWRRERLPALPDTPYLSVAPDWVCEILSPSTTRLDRGPKRDIYAGAEVQYLWLLNPVSRVLEAFQLTAGKWLLLGTATGSDDVSVPPFDAISFSLDLLFPFDPPLNETSSEG